MLSRLKILQVGDVHLPTAAKAERNLDQKDRTFSVELRNVISAVPTKVVFKKIYELIENDKIDALLFMGDFTDLGSVENYDRSTAYLANALQIGAGRTHEDLLVGIVPGNHDVNRELAKEPGLETKFGPLNEALLRHGLPALPVEKTITKPITSGSGTVELNLVNSCWGCGASEYIPEEFREGIGAAIEKAIAEGGTGPLRAYYDRQFDTPAFSSETIEDLVRRAREGSQSALMMIVAHHNLLPQRMTRLAPYTELVNSGALRASLVESGRPTLYLHGHIHEDPVEVLSIPGGQNLICISAPAAEDGFNIVEVLFTRLGLPLACHVWPWRFDGSGILLQQPRLSLPLIGRKRRSHDRSLTQIYGHLLTVGECFWTDLVNHSPPFFTNENEAMIQEAVELLVADDTIVIENYEMDPVNWIIRAII